MKRRRGRSSTRRPPRAWPDGEAAGSQPAKPCGFGSEWLAFVSGGSGRHERGFAVLRSFSLSFPLFEPESEFPQIRFHSAYIPFHCMKADSRKFPKTPQIFRFSTVFLVPRTNPSPAIRHGRRRRLPQLDDARTLRVPQGRPGDLPR